LAGEYIGGRFILQAILVDYIGPAYRYVSGAIWLDLSNILSLVVVRKPYFKQTGKAIRLINTMNI